MHLTSQVSGDLVEGRSPIDVLRATLPAGTVSGAPKVRAMEIIDELEPVKRGPYAGVVGYVDFSGNLDTAIAIRTMFVGPQGASLQAGAGIVADSIPDDEDLECRNKAAALLAAVPGRPAHDGEAGRGGHPRMTERTFWVAAPRDVVRVSGPDARSYLQSQLSQDLSAVPVGTTTWSFLLQPTGKVAALVRVTFVGDDEVLLDVDGGSGPDVVARLERFRIRVKADIEALDWRAIAVRGDAPEPPPTAGSSSRRPGGGRSGATTSSAPTRRHRRGCPRPTRPRSRPPASRPVGRRWGRRSRTRPSPASSARS